MVNHLVCKLHVSTPCLILPVMFSLVLLQSCHFAKHRIVDIESSWIKYFKSFILNCIGLAP